MIYAARKKNAGSETTDKGEPKSNTPLDIGDDKTLVSSTRGIHKDCGGMVAAISDPHNWPDEHILVCQNCRRAITSNEMKGDQE